jgi:uncharacterized protein (DUF1499 family)
MKRSLILVMGLVMMFSLFGCSGQRPADIGVRENRLAPCPSRPNCVASDAEDAEHRIEPLAVGNDASAAWQALKDIIADLPRITIVASEDRYLHVEAKSRLLGFVDDLEFHLRSDDGVIAIRSAARIGYSDLGVNAARIETIRAELQAKGFS